VTSALAHVQQFAVASTAETTETLVGRADVECHVMREDIIVEQAIAKEITHGDVEMVRRFGAEFRRDESYVSALSLTALVFELPLSDVAVVDGERAVLECRVAVTPAAEVYLVSIVCEVERELESIGRPAAKSSTRQTDPHTSAAPLNNDDRELSAFCAAQIDAHAADVDASTAHRLVYVSDIIARHVIDQSVGDRIAAAANELCSQLKLVAMRSRNVVLGNRRLAERRTANTWTDTDTDRGECQRRSGSVDVLGADAELVVGPLGQVADHVDGRLRPDPRDARPRR